MDQLVKVLKSEFECKEEIERKYKEMSMLVYWEKSLNSKIILLDFIKPNKYYTNTTRIFKQILKVCFIYKQKLPKTS